MLSTLASVAALSTPVLVTAAASLAFTLGSPKASRPLNISHALASSGPALTGRAARSFGCALSTNWLIAANGKKAVEKGRSGVLLLLLLILVAPQTDDFPCPSSLTRQAPHPGWRRMADRALRNRMGLEGG